MRRKKYVFNLLIALTMIGLIFTSCEKDNKNDGPSGKPSDETIEINDSSAFNMKNFVKSFDQMFVADNRWGWSFTHDYDDGKATTSYQNYKIYGKFGDKVFSITHAYNADGVIESSTRTASMFESNEVVFTYEYNKEGFITKLTKKSKNKIKDIVSHEYDENGNLVKKTHEPVEAGDESWSETFTYNSEGLVASYENENWTEKDVYTYSSGNMIQVKEYYDNVLEETYNYEYDGSGRVTKEYEEGFETEYVAYEYGSDALIVKDYDDGVLYYMAEHGLGLEEIKSYNYEYLDGEFQYCRAKENDEDGNTAKKYYYEGSVDNLQLVGYSVIDSRDAEKDDKKTKESLYDASDNLLYYVEFVVTKDEGEDYWYISDKNWFSADGTAIEETAITEAWVFILVR
jgi:hypothetical protein